MFRKNPTPPSVIRQSSSLCHGELSFILELPSSEQVSTARRTLAFSCIVEHRPRIYKYEDKYSRGVAEAGHSFRRLHFPDNERGKKSSISTDASCCPDNRKCAPRSPKEADFRPSPDESGVMTPFRHLVTFSRTGFAFENTSLHLGADSTERVDKSRS